MLWWLRSVRSAGGGCSDRGPDCGEFRQLFFEVPLGLGPDEQAFDHHPDLEADDSDAEEEQVLFFRVKEPAGLAVEHVPEHGPGGHDEHDDHGDQGEDDGFVATTEVEDDDHEGQAGEQLVGGTEEGPENQAATTGTCRGAGGHHGDHATQGDRQSGGCVFVGERFDVHGRREFLDDVSLQTRGGIEGGGSEAGHKDGDDADAELHRDADGTQEVGTSVNEGTDFVFQAERAPAFAGVVTGFPGSQSGQLGVGPCGECGLIAVGGSFSDAGEITHAHAGTAGEDHDDSQAPFEEHGTVADVLGVHFGFDLFTTGTAADQAVETATGTAGDGNKQEGPDGRGIGGDVGGNRGGGADEVCFSSSTGDQGSDEQQSQRENQLVAVDEIARLEQQPDRHDRSDGTIRQQDEGPENDRVGERSHVGDAEQCGDIDGPVVGTHVDRSVYNDQRDERGDEQFCILFIDHQADHNGDGHSNPDGDDRLGIEREDDGNHQSEDGKHHGQSEQQDQEEQDTGAGGNQSAGHFTNGLSPVAQRHHQRTEVVNGADENRPKEHPEECRQPAPEDGNRGTNDGSGAGDAGEVVAEDDFFFGGDEVDIVTQLFTGNFRICVDVKDFLGEPLTIGVVSDDVTDKGSRSNQQCGHWSFTPAFVPKVGVRTGLDPEGLLNQRVKHEAGSDFRRSKSRWDAMCVKSERYLQGYTSAGELAIQISPLRSCLYSHVFIISLLIASRALKSLQAVRLGYPAERYASFLNVLIYPILKGIFSVERSM